MARVPLWERARREKVKVENKVKSVEVDVPTDDPPPLTLLNNSNALSWWNNEWMEGIEKSLGNYPLICRVEKTQAEFPPDPLADEKIVRPDGSFAWKAPDTIAKAKVKKKAYLRLAVTLRPLTTLIPPVWSESGPVVEHALTVPPPFTCVTFPSTEKPFLIPFAWGYIKYHSLSNDDDIVFSKSSAEQKGKIKGFNSLEGNFGSPRFDDKLSLISSMLGNWSKTEPSDSDSIPPQDAFVVREFLTNVVRNYDVPADTFSTDNCDRVSFIDFIRCTLPLWEGVSTLKTLNDRKAKQSQFWELESKKARLNNDEEVGGFRDVLKYGITRTLDSALRLQLELTIEEFLGYQLAAGPFRPTVTDDMVPSYSNAVPISMSFDRILSRLKEKGVANQCYYRSLDAVLVDLNLIADNCALYNAPDSDLVRSAYELIPLAKNALKIAASRFLKDQTDKTKTADDKKEFVLLPVGSDAVVVQDQAGGKVKKVKPVDPFQDPYNGPLYRDWLHCTLPDTSRPKADDDQGQKLPAFSQWIPQAGDTVLYSRQLHAEFIQGHYDDLAPNQRILPQLKDSAGNDISANDQPDSPLSEKVPVISRNQWIKGTIAYMRTEFPRKHKASGNEKDKKKPTFATNAPLLGIAVKLFGAEGEGSKTSVVYWRPCVFSHDLADSSMPSIERCSCCKLHLATSFLRPSWVDRFDSKLGDDTGCSPSMDVSVQWQKEATAIERGFCLLKHRCLNEVPPDFLDPKLSVKKVKQGYVPAAIKVDTNSLPFFEDLFDSSNIMSTRKVQPRKPSKTSVANLVNCNYLPPWYNASGVVSKEASSTPLHEMVTPAPSLCLELIHCRLRDGYYRQKAALAHDISEAFVTSVLLYLVPFVRRKNQISMKKLAKALASTKYSVFAPTPFKPQIVGESEAATFHEDKTSTKSKADLKTKMKDPKKEPNSKNHNFKKASKMMEENAAPSIPEHGLKPEKIPKVGSLARKEQKGSLSEEEQEILHRLVNIRRLYVAALTFTSDIRHAEHLHGLVPLAVSRQNLRNTLETHVRSQIQTAEKVQAAHAHRVLATLTAASQRDMCINMDSKASANQRPTVTVKIAVGGEPVKVEETVLSKPLNLSPLPNAGQDQVGNHTMPEATIAPELPKPTLVVRDGIQFHHRDLENNLQLSQLFFGKTGRMHPCIRCQTQRRSMVACRVIKQHSNVDFDLKS